MAHNRELSEKPLVSLEAGKLLGMRQVAKVSAGRADGTSRDPAGSTGGAADSRADMSRLLSKIGPEVPVEAAGSRAEMSRLLSKIDETPGKVAAASRAEMSRLLSKIGITETETDTA